MHALDRPVWTSLTTYHAPRSEGGDLARRFIRDINLFGSARDDSTEAAAALAALVKPGEEIYVLQVPAIVTPPGLRLLQVANGVQMVASEPAPRATADDEVLTLSDADAPEMQALAKLTQPGPFAERTHTMGRFVGIRINGRLAAMAGERMRMPGYTEVSGVCTHPDCRGRGLAARLSAVVAARIEARGERPFLHAWKENVAAISLYEKLGFRVRTEVNVAILGRA
ncbi:MAG TPA: GNAT family N-acetyltransferase [Gammaproteobacteria bacterium]|nr:GNAT family N-acetyltransferase [Gammaproteobacteria bacterium]